MRIVILAAGIGSRLGNPFPKPLTPLKNGKSILEMMTENIGAYFSIDDILVVVGFKKEVIMEAFPQLTYVYNPYFDQTNTSKSLLDGLVKCRGEGVLWLNGDVVFDQSLLRELIPHIKEDHSFVAVNTNAVGKEEVKYTVDGDFICELSKNVKNGLGEAVGVNYISSKELDQFLIRLGECGANDYFEKGMELLIEKDNAKVRPIDISKFNCMEIDFAEDLREANKFLQEDK